MRKLLTLFIIGILLVVINHSVDAYEIGGQSVPWLDWSAGAKAIGLGRSHTAIEGQGVATILNPADLAWQEKNYLTLMHTPSGDNINFDLGGVSYSMKDLNAGIGFGYLRLATENIEEYDYEGNFVGYFDDVEQAAVLGIGQKLAPNLAIGGTVKVINQNLYNERGIGYSIDFGAKWEPVEKLMIGAVFYNLAGHVNWSTDFIENLPLRFRGGVSYYWSKPDLLFTGEYLYDQGDTPFHLGLEKGYQKNLRFRVGLDGLKPTFGIGLVMARLEVDYALILDSDFGKRQYLSLNWRY